MDINAYIAKFTSDPQTKRILQNISAIDDSPDSRCVLRSFLNSELNDIISKKTPNLLNAAKTFLAVPEPNNIKRAFQLYIWLKEKIPQEQDRESLILLGMMKYIEGEKRESSAREIVSFLAMR